MLLSGCKAKVDLENIDPSAEVKLGMALPVATASVTLGDFMGDDKLLNQIQVGTGTDKTVGENGVDKGVLFFRNESESDKDSFEDKGNRVDVKAKTDKGEIIIVEVQLTKESDFFQRIIFGTVTAINNQIGIGQDYGVIHKVYSINILYFNFGSGDDYAFHGVTTFRGMTNKDAVLKLNTRNEREYMNRERRRMTSPDEVFPEYFLLIVDRFNEVAKTPIEEWMAYLKDGAIRDDTTTPGLQEARRKLNYMSMTEEERKSYKEYMVSVHAAQDAIETAKSEGRAEGLAEGREEGLAEGREVGLAEGIDAAKRDSALRMKSDGMPAELIAKYTGLTTEQIDSL